MTCVKAKRTNCNFQSRQIFTEDVLFGYSFISVDQKFKCHCHFDDSALFPGIQKSLASENETDLLKALTVTLQVVGFSFRPLLLYI